MKNKYLNKVPVNTIPIQNHPQNLQNNPSSLPISQNVVKIPLKEDQNNQNDDLQEISDPPLMNEIKKNENEETNSEKYLNNQISNAKEIKQENNLNVGNPTNEMNVRFEENEKQQPKEIKENDSQNYSQNNGNLSNNAEDKNQNDSPENPKNIFPLVPPIATESSQAFLDELFNNATSTERKKELIMK